MFLTRENKIIFWKFLYLPDKNREAWPFPIPWLKGGCEPGASVTVIQPKRNQEV